MGAQNYPNQSMNRAAAEPAKGSYPNLSSARQVEVLGTQIQSLSTTEVLDGIFALINSGRPHSVYLVNAATANLAYEYPIYRSVLNRGDLVLNDGTGVRWAARRQGIRLEHNHVGTDLIPKLWSAGQKIGLRVFLYGGRPGVAERAGQSLSQFGLGSKFVGAHHGYVLPSDEEDVCAEINRLEPDLVLVALGNPWQELWIDRHLQHLKKGVAIGVGGLFDHLAGNLTRAPLWVRRAGCEWVQLLLQQPHKWPRYLIGNPLFLYRLMFGRPRGT